MNITHMSVSRYGVWDECKNKYKYKYHLKMDSLEPEPFYFTYGKIFHSIAEEYVIRKGESTLGEVAKAVLNQEIPYDQDKNGNPVYYTSMPPDYRDKLSIHLKSLRELTEKIGFEGYTEYNFKYDLDPPNNKNLVGFIDRLFEKNGLFYVIDYKTTQKGPYRKTKKTVTSDLQLRCYAKVVQRDFNVKAENIRTALYYVDGADLIGAQFSQQSLDAAEEELKNVYSLVENTNENDVWGNVGEHCTRCGYRKICPFYRNEKI
jgi:CRISPR/Cas system-associated exonuclease Cas4 (RecB family)